MSPLNDSRCSECAQWIKLGHSLTCSRHPAAKPSQPAGYRRAGFVSMRRSIPGFDDSHLRALRLWHWRECLTQRDLERRSPANSNVGPMHERAANFHLKAVQALNDCFDIDDTAEKDAAK